MLVTVAVDDPFYLGVLSSQIHASWAIRTGGWLGMGNDPRYSKSRCFDPFPFPETSGPRRNAIASLAEEIDAHRKARQAAHPNLTLTGIYNVLEELRRTDDPNDLDEASHGICEQGLILILKELHDTLDAAVADAYGWPADMSDEEIVARLVALNRERAAEEARGIVRWLRPEYQIPRLGKTAPRGKQLEAALSVSNTDLKKPSFGSDEVTQTASVMAALASARGALDAGALATSFRQGKRIEPKVLSILGALVRMGYGSSTDGGRTFGMRQVA
jgi:hypothetical protein